MSDEQFSIETYRISPTFQKSRQNLRNQARRIQRARDRVNGNIRPSKKRKTKSTSGSSTSRTDGGFEDRENGTENLPVEG